MRRTTLNGFFAFLTVPPAARSRRTCMEPEDVRRRLVLHRATRAGGRRRLPQSAPGSVAPASIGSAPIPHPALQGMFDALYPAGEQWYWKADFVNELPDAADRSPCPMYGEQLPTWQIDHAPLSDRWGGRPGCRTMPRPGISATRIGRRRWSESALIRPITTRMIAWARDYWAALHPLLSRRRLRQHDDGRMRATTGYAPPTATNYDRLAAVKAKYDPDNLFRVNQNIRPA